MRDFKAEDRAALEAGEHSGVATALNTIYASVGEKAVLGVTRRLPAHQLDYDGPCECPDCLEASV